MKCLDKKRLKLKNGEKAAMNERNVLAQVPVSIAKQQ